MTTLTDFLRARIAEDEAVARAAKSGPWDWELTHYSDGSLETCDLVSSDHWTAHYSDAVYRTSVFQVSGMHTEGYLDCEPADRDHIARHDPARVLAMCYALTAIAQDHAPDDGTNCIQCDRRYPCWTLRELGAVYSGHPDYREEWRP